MTGNSTFSDAYNGYFSSDLSLYDEFDNHKTNIISIPLILSITVILIFLTILHVFLKMRNNENNNIETRSLKVINSSITSKESDKCNPNSTLPMSTIQEDSESLLSLTGENESSLNGDVNFVVIDGRPSSSNNCFYTRF